MLDPEKLPESCTVSIIVPCRNEARFIAEAVTGILSNGFSADRLEILVVDGMSTDGTRDIVQNYTNRYRQIRLIDNPHKVTPYALNIGIRNATGDVIMRLDAHTVCEKDYITRCVSVLFEYGADDVGGTLRIAPRESTLIGKAIVKALTLRFGVGNLRYRFAQLEEPEIVDTVPFFCCRRQLFQEVGLFNEKLTRIQDMEFKRRLFRSGRRIMLAPGAYAQYKARSDLPSFWAHNWSDGLWIMLAFASSNVMPVRWRHLVPACFVGSLIVSASLALFWTPFAWALAAIILIYSLPAVFLSGRIGLEEREWRYVFLVPFVICSMHIMRGAGSICGAMRLFFEGNIIHAVRLLLREQYRLNPTT